MSEHPILFSTDMVKAILDKRKTQTRRIVKFPKWIKTDEYIEAWIVRDLIQGRCPYGQVGDRLWVRETWREPINKGSGFIDYLADYDRKPLFLKWRPSIFMPRWASRITLEITSIRVERLQEISENDAKAEGIYDGNPLFNAYEPDFDLKLKDAYKRLWDSINVKKHPWESNPWVWAIEFNPDSEVQP